MCWVGFVCLTFFLSWFVVTRVCSGVGSGLPATHQPATVWCAHVTGWCRQRWSGWSWNGQYQTYAVTTTPALHTSECDHSSHACSTADSDSGSAAPGVTARAASESGAAGR